MAEISRVIKSSFIALTAEFPVDVRNYMMLVAECVDFIVTGRKWQKSAFTNI